MKNKNILIITIRKEQEVDGVIDYLRNHNIDITRWNLCQFPGREFCTVTPSSFILPHTTQIKPSVGWLHHFGQFSIENTLIGLQREVAIKETESFTKGLLLSIPCIWLNNPSDIIKASNKIFQLKLAKTLGIPIPDFIVTNNRNSVKNFVAQKKSVIIKSISTGYINYGEQKLKIYTREYDTFNKKQLSTLKFSPVLVQEKILKRKEIRITVVGNKCFSVEIDYLQIPEVTDVRELISKNNYEYFTRAEGVQMLEKKSLEFLRRLGLKYGAIDWIKSQNGKYFFLEINPLGSFKWFEQCAGFNITDTIGKLFLQMVTK